MLRHYYQDKKVLVTGGCGFIGSHLVERLVTYGAQVTVLDDLSSGSLANIGHIKDHITFIQGSITNMHNCMQAVAHNSHIFHLAAYISVPGSIVKPDICHQINVDGTFNLLDAARHAQVKRFIFSSSAAVYGTTEERCVEDMLCNPESPYGFSKLMGEQLCQQFRRVYGLQTVILRYFNVFGQRQNSQGAYAAVVAKFSDAMRNNEPITIFSDGLQTRDFIPVQQVVDANLMVGMLPTEQLHENIFNVATGQSITLLELIARLKKEYPDYNKEPHFLPARAGDIKGSYADCSRLERLYKTE